MHNSGTGINLRQGDKVKEGQYYVLIACVIYNTKLWQWQLNGLSITHTIHYRAAANHRFNSPVSCFPRAHICKYFYAYKNTYKVHNMPTSTKSEHYIKRKFSSNPTGDGLCSRIQSLWPLPRIICSQTFPPNRTELRAAEAFDGVYFTSDRHNKNDYTINKRLKIKGLVWF